MTFARHEVWIYASALKSSPGYLSHHPAPYLLNPLVGVLLYSTQPSGSTLLPLHTPSCSHEKVLLNHLYQPEGCKYLLLNRLLAAAITMRKYALIPIHSRRHTEHQAIETKPVFYGIC